MTTLFGSRGPSRHNLGPLERIPLGEGRRFALVEHLIAVFRSRRGALFATQAACPHRGGPLADGTVGGAELLCPLHGFRFDLATGRPLGNACSALRTYPVEATRDGDVVIELEA